MASNVMSVSVIAKCDSRTWRGTTARKNAAIAAVTSSVTMRASLKSTTIVNDPAIITRARAIM